jgi:hypothetical protein
LWSRFDLVSFMPCGRSIFIEITGRVKWQTSFSVCYYRMLPLF